MTPLRLSYIWYSRLYLALIAISLSYLVLFLLQQFNVVPELIEGVPNLQVNTIVAVGAGIVILSSTILLFLRQKVKSTLVPLGVFAIFAITTAYLTLSTGGINSAFIIAWVLVVFTVPILGVLGWLSVLALTGAYITSEYLSSGLPIPVLAAILFSSLVPLIAGAILWRNSHSSDDHDAHSRNVKNLASQLSEVANKSEIVINAIGDGVIAVDGKGVIQLINPSAQEILGWGKQDALMLNYKSIFKLTDEHNKELEDNADPIQQVLNTNQQSRAGKLIALTQSGKKVSVSLVVSPIGDPGAGAITVFRDVTKERSEEREQAEFISTASHEMRTPVASIEGYLGLALNPATATIDSKARDYIKKAQESAQHLGRLFQDLLDVSQSEDGRMTILPKVVDVTHFIETIVEGLTPQANEKGLSIKFEPSAQAAQSSGQRKIMPVYHVNLDNNHLREVVENLIENAIKYTITGEVIVDITGAEDTVVISVKDTGLGIPTEDIPHLFQKFYRVDNLDRQEIGGTGLGLYLTRRLVESMQGRLWVESAFGQGSTFFIELPRLSSQEADNLKEEQDYQANQAAEQAFSAAAPPMPVATDVSQPAVQQPVAQPTQPQALPTQPVAPQPAQAAQPQATPQPQVAPQPQATHPAPQPNQQAPKANPQQQPTTTVKPATTVPRGESLTREQIAERVRQLEELSKQNAQNQGQGQ